MTDYFKTGLYIVAGRPAMGKTAFANTMAVDMAKHGTRVGIYYLETTAESNWKRMQAIISGIPLWKIQSGKLTDDEMIELETASHELTNLPLHPFDSNTIEINELIKQLKIIKRQYDIDIFFIDQLTHIRNSGKHDNKTYEIEDTVRALSDLRKELDIPIVLMHQLNRGLYDKAEKRPSLEHLKSSGGIEQEADVVILLHRPYYYKIDEEGINEAMREEAEWIVAKNRDGRTGIVKVRWQGELTKFSYIHSIGDVINS